tara:strand:+ start:505 stop:1539 length:1035 start_codon:yes stop_codon:yes gene_type:complete
MTSLNKIKLTNKKILLIGGAGYIGSVLIKNFLRKNYKVKCLDALVYSQHHSIEPFLKKSNFEFILGDIRNYSQTKNLFKEITDVIILAGLVGDPITKRYPKESKEINFIALKNFIDECKGKKLEKVIFISTCSNYGLINNDDKADENYTLSPLSDYAKHKVDIENYIISLKDQVDYSPTVLRFATAFGISPRMRFDLTINEFTRELYLKNNIVIYDANTWRPYCHVNDFVNLINKVLKSEKKKINFQIFNAGGDNNNSTKLGIVECLKKYFPESKVNFKDKGEDPRNYRVDFSKVKNVLDFEPKYTIEDGIKEIVTVLKKGKFKYPDQYGDNLGNYKINNELIV